MTDTERLRAEDSEETASLRREVSALRAAVEFAPTLIFFHGEDGELLRVNRTAAEFLGRDLLPEEAEGVFAANAEVLRTGEPRLGEIARFVTIDPERWFRIDSVPMVEPGGDIRGLIVFATDVSGYVASEEELRVANEELSRANEELDEFTATAGHDLKAPLREMLAFATLLEKDLGTDLPPEASKDLLFILDSAKKMRALIDSLLTLSRAGRAELDRRELPLDECADVVVKALSALIRESGATIERDELPTVRGDRTLLTQLYQNLVANALKYCGDGPPRVRFTAVREAGGWVFGVRDEGLGVPNEYREQIFQPFQRLHGHGQYPGSGVGLAICKKVVDRHGGRLWVDSEPGEWSHFQFTLGGENPVPLESS